MKHLMLILLFLSSALLSNPSNANKFVDIEYMDEANWPKSKLYKLNGPIPVVEASPFDLKQLQSEDSKLKERGTALRFAIPFGHIDTLKHRGVWEKIKDDWVWRVTLSAKSAKSINIGFKNLFIPKGAKLYIYNKDSSLLLGPYTHKDNKHHRQLWTPVLESSELTVEFNVPDDVKHLMSFDFAKVNQGYRSINKDTISKTGACNNDVVCPEGDAWRDQIRSVARYTINGVFLCTGTLVNNVSQDRRPYFLTASHCGVNQSTSPSMVFYWNYETSICQGTPDGSLAQFQNGAAFRSNYVPADSALVILDSVPDASFNTYWSGWDNSAPPPNSAVAIHHPDGDEKRISFDNDPLTTTEFFGNIIVEDGTHLRVGNWEDGTTEPGSSGSALWNPEGLIVGTLEGGRASCDAPEESDWYGRLHMQWTGNNTPQTQLQHWLDPEGTNTIALEGAESCQPPAVSITNAPTTAFLNEPVTVSATIEETRGAYTLEWDFNDDGFVDSTEENPVFSFPYFYRGNIRLTVVDENNCAGMDTTAISVGSSSSEFFPVNPQLPENWDVSDSADAGWFFTSNESFEGNNSLTSQSVTDDQTASIEVTETIDVENGFVGFAARVSSEVNFDFLRFYIDDVEMGAWSGDTGWFVVNYPLSVGTHTLRWSYEKDESISEGNDGAWIDAITGLTREEVINTPPIASVAQTTFSADENTNVILNATRSSDPQGDDITFLWEQTGGPSVTLTNENTASASFIAPEVDSNSTLTFMVTVTDTEQASSTAQVTVTIIDTTPGATPTPSPQPSGGSSGGALPLSILGALLYLVYFRNRRVVLRLDEKSIISGRLL